MNSIHCKCGTFVGTWTPATYYQPSEASLSAEAFTDDDGIPFCSEECYREVHPRMCAGCGDAPVESERGVCEGCRTSEPSDWINVDDYLEMKTLADLCDALPLMQEKRVA